MRRRFIISALVLGLPAFFCCSQGAFVYDQQSSSNPGSAGGGPVIQGIPAPYGQSFTPAFSSIGFIQLGLFDKQPGNGLGATLLVNLMSAINGPVLASTTPVSLPDGFGLVGTPVVDLFFIAEVPLVSGTTYYFQPVVQSGDLWGVSAGEFNYSGGSVFLDGLPASGDYWFREGIIPEPSSAALILFGIGIFWRRRSRKKQQNPCDVAS
jgi:hypothetical protein